MSLETAAKDLAAELTRHEFIEIRCHHDADGIAAGSIMASALYRARIPFRLRVTRQFRTEDVPAKSHLLLCDLGAGLADLPEETMVIDHHLPVFEGPCHVNPRLAGIDGDYELSAAGAAYIVANAIGDNRDLAGLILPGIIGDGQHLSGKNQELYLEAMGNGIIAKSRGIRLPGRDLGERVRLATMPFFPDYSGNEEAVSGLLPENGTETGNEQEDLIFSRLMLNAAKTGTPEAIMNFWGDTYQLSREIIEDAHTMTLLVDACGKAGEGSLAVELCMKSGTELGRVWEIATTHRMEVIAEIRSFLSGMKPEETARVYETRNPLLASDIADTIFRSLEGTGPVIISAPGTDGSSLLSIRGTANGEGGLGTIVSTLASECGGYGGGHVTRAGATIATEFLPAFISRLVEVCS